MKMDVRVNLFGIFYLLFILYTQHLCQEMSLKRQTSTFQHPAYSMFAHSPMSFPGLAGHRTSGVSGSECILGDIVCPSWCLMEDEWGCKYCPCGPANGMSPPVMTEEHGVHHESRHECLGTMLCMLTCKDGYRLGPRRENGCQSCFCTKKTTIRVSSTTPPTTTTTKEMTHAVNASSHTFGQMVTGSSTSSKDCKWPLCMNAKSPHGGPQIGSASTSSAGGFVSPGDCFGPSCSAKNGMRLVNQFSGSNSKQPSPPGPIRVPTTPMIPTPGTSRRCPLTDECVQSCTGSVQLAPPTEPGGCPLCKCVKPEVIVPLPVPVRTSCPQIEKCKADCRAGFQITPAISIKECPRCSCVQQMVPVLPAIPVPKPNYLSVCPGTVHCMETCTSGYTLAPPDTDGCPKCTCNTEPKLILLCKEPLSCPRGCTIGYRCDGTGCPTCACVSQYETHVATVVKSELLQTSLTCAPDFSCSTKCSFGYKTGDNGCPTCTCLTPLTGQHIKSSVSTAAETCPATVQCIVECKTGQYTLTSVPGRTCPQCQCQVKEIQCKDTECTANARKEPSSVVPSPGQCMAILHCVMTCQSGYDVGKYDKDGCPTCSCIE